MNRFFIAFVLLLEISLPIFSVYSQSHLKHELFDKRNSSSKLYKQLYLLAHSTDHHNYSHHHIIKHHSTNHQVKYLQKQTHFTLAKKTEKFSKKPFHHKQRKHVKVIEKLDDNEYRNIVNDNKHLGKYSNEDDIFEAKETATSQEYNKYRKYEESLSKNESIVESNSVLNPKPENSLKECPKCTNNNNIELITEEELTRLRIEFVKTQILEKLRLKKRPNVSAVGLPKPIYEGITVEHPDDAFKNKYIDEYYARTNKKFIFLKKEINECKGLDNHPFMCFSFKINDSDIDGYNVNTAVLWIYKNKQKSPQNNTIPSQQTIVVSELEQQHQSQYLPLSRTIAIQSVNVDDEWMKIDIEWPIKRWFGNHDLSHLIQITCQSCNIKKMEEIITIDKDYRPFIIVNTQNRKKQSRHKRSINCSAGIIGCCREKLYISFHDIGWGDWIVHPAGYDAYFCRGSCKSVASITQAISQHTNILQRAYFATKSAEGEKRVELTPCCTAKHYSSLQLVYMDSNNTATQKIFPNMVVESCGCR